MRTVQLAWVVCFALAACSGSTESDGSGATGGASGSGAAGGSGGASGNGGSGGSSGSGATGGTSVADGSAGSSGAFQCQDSGTFDAGTEGAVAASCVVAVVKVTRLDEECSGAGGTHVTLDVIEIGRGSGVTRVSHGGHAYYAPPSGPDAIGDVFVAGIDPFGMLVERPDNPGWCLSGLPSVDGAAHTLLAAASEADAKTKMAQILSQ